MNNTALAVRTDIDELQTIGQVFVKSGFFADTKDAAQAIVKVMAGAELGFPAIASMTGVYIVKGKVSLSANLMAAAIKKNRKYNYKVRHLDEQKCAIEFFEGGESIGISTFTMAEAHAAKLHQDYKDGAWKDKPTWKNFPRNMLFARAMSNGAKWFTPDIFGGPIYTPDELGAEVDGETGEMAGVIEAPAVEPSPVDDYEAVLNDAIEPEPVRDVKLEGAKPAADAHPGQLPELKGTAGQVTALAKALKWDSSMLAQAIEAKFGLIVSPGYLAETLEFMGADEHRELVRVLKAKLQGNGGKR